MSVKPDQLYEKEYNCKITDLVGGFPPETDHTGKAFPDGAKMYVWDDTTKTLKDIYKYVFNQWYKI